MALSNEDKKDVSRAFGKKAAGAVSRATHDNGKLNSQMRNGQNDADFKRSSSIVKSKALGKKTGSFERMNKERGRQGYKPKTDRASKGMYDFFDKYDK